MNFRGKHLFQATKRQLNGEKENVCYLPAFSCGVLVSSVWKNVGVTIQNVRRFSGLTPFSSRKEQTENIQTENERDQIRSRFY